jgi:hypothetical protein
MLKYCYEKWNKNQGLLEEALRNVKLNEQSYESLLALTVEHVLNPGDSNEYYWDTNKITVVDDGDYQGTILFLIPRDSYQPSEYEYLMTYIGYGSCCCCDYLQSIQPWSDEPVTDEVIKKFMGLCKDFITNMIKPYNSGWREDDNFKPVSMEVTTND